ncbi:Alpha/Beta hydrolase protein [Lentinula boryana]|uniref:Alpha/Beta hydrolase protein n=1 Tax=Lentinula boryana TaxID=40481 RepID=A0ABQ8QH48_9AGAR|nr:Alpha/Beta hydrolase protein [Lentinula boryana]
MPTPQSSPEWLLRLKVLPLRFFTNLAFSLDELVRPRPPKPSKTIKIPRTIPDDESENGKRKREGKNKELLLQVYYPLSHQQSTLPKPMHPELKPVVVNFHGSGFMLGHATDDARWARSVAEYVDAIVVSVEYRLAPEHPFPAALDDGVEALLWIIHHAEELGVDPHRIALSGFSAGGSLTFGVPMRLGEEMRKRKISAGNECQQKEGTFEAGFSPVIPHYRIVFIAAWYPSVDYSLTRAQRRATNVRQDKNLPAWFTNLVDTCFLLGVGEADKKLPWLSPALAPAEMLKEYLPHDIVVRVCEWDELRAEAENFCNRLASEEGSRRGVGIKVIEGAIHGWDKHPSLNFRWDAGIEEVYKEVCVEMRKVLLKK